MELKDFYINKIDEVSSTVDALKLLYCQEVVLPDEKDTSKCPDGGGCYQKHVRI